jgi:hypothetical protein
MLKSPILHFRPFINNDTTSPSLKKEQEKLVKKAAEEIDRILNPNKLMGSTLQNGFEKESRRMRL